MSKPKCLTCDKLLNLKNYTLVSYWDDPNKRPVTIRVHAECRNTTIASYYEAGILFGTHIHN